MLFTSGQAGLEFTRDTDLLVDTVRKLSGRQNPFMNVTASTWPGPLQHFDPANRPGGGGDPGTERANLQGAAVQNQAGNDLFWSTMQGALDKLPKHDGRRKALVILSEGTVVTSAAGQLANTPSASNSDYSAAIPEVGMYTSPTPGRLRPSSRRLHRVSSPDGDVCLRHRSARQGDDGAGRIRAGFDVSQRRRHRATAAVVAPSLHRSDGRVRRRRHERSCDRCRSRHHRPGQLLHPRLQAPES